MKCFLSVSIVSISVFFAALWYWLANHSTFRGNWSQIRSPLIIFDFDGTICPSYPLFIDQVNLLADEYTLRKIRSDEVEELRNMTPADIMKRLGISPFKLPFLLRKIRRNVQQQLLELQPVPGIVEALQELRRRRYSLGILTSNSPENVLLYLQKYNIDFFDFVYTGNNIFGKEKHLKEILKKGSLDFRKDLVIYIGDEIRDMDAARKACYKSIGVIWGYNCLPLLQGSNPDFLSETPSQLLFLIETAGQSVSSVPQAFPSQKF